MDKRETIFKTITSKQGKVLNTAVDPGVDVEIKVTKNVEKKKERVSVDAKNFGETFLVDPDNPRYDTYPLLQAAICSLPVPEDLELNIKIDSSIPAGSSTGTSASVCVALLGAMDRISSQRHTAKEIACLAHRAETEKLGWQSGIQDQICAAYGGVCLIDMYSYPEAHVSKLKLRKQVRNSLNSRLCLICLGSEHSSSMLHEEGDKTPRKQRIRIHFITQNEGISPGGQTLFNGGRPGYFREDHEGKQRMPAFAASGADIRTGRIRYPDRQKT